MCIKNPSSSDCVEQVSASMYVYVYMYMCIYRTFINTYV